jgi:hypothetical protein
VQLDRLAVQLRLRNPWEAADLGFAMTRAWFRPLYAAWLTVFVPVCAIALLLLPPAWAMVLVWWLKPVFERVVLHVLAAGVFGELPRLRSTLRALPQALMPGLLASLTWYRFFLARSFNLPVWQLERQTGRAARRRRRQLHRRTGSYAVWLTIACIHFELVLALSGIALYDLVRPASQVTGFQFFELLSSKNETLREILVALFAFGAMTILEPCYVAGGFALYLNRRTALEGWDLEVALRRMSERAHGRSQPAAFARAALVLLIATAAALVWPPTQVGAQDAAAPAQATGETSAAQAQAAAAVQRGRAAREIRNILKRPEFDEYRVRTILEPLHPKAEQKQQRRRTTSSGWATFIDMLSQLLRILAYAAVGVAVVFLLYYLVRHVHLLKSSKQPYVPPDTLFGLDVRPESLPDDVGAAALALARNGELLKALSLLYRGALAALLHREGLELVSGDTEADCLRKSGGRLREPAHAYFGQLVGAWQRLAYGRRAVASAEVERLCLDWSQYFGGAA